MMLSRQRRATRVLAVWSTILPRANGIAREDSGAAVVEFSLLAPPLMLLWFGVMQFGPVLQQQTVLQVAAHQGAQVLSTGRTVASIYTQTTSVITSAISSLSGTVTATLSVCDSSGGSCTACSSDASCATLFASAQGDVAQVQLSYACDLIFPVGTLSSVSSLSVTEYSLIQ
jgi:Flp pilus assembly protein TadG